LQAHAAHQARHRASRDALALPLQLPPHFAHSIDLEVVVEHAPDFPAPNAPNASRSRFGIAPARDMLAIRRRGDRQDLADRLDPVRLPMLVDERGQGLNRRSSSAWAKYADALRRISFAWRSSRFSRTSALSRSRSSVVSPARLP